jgi:hypothetical protein
MGARQPVHQAEHVAVVISIQAHKYRVVKLLVLSFAGTKWNERMMIAQLRTSLPSK